MALDDLESAATSGGDTLVGSAAADTLRGFAGDDLLRGLGDGDLLVGGVGSDTLYGNGGSDLLVAGQELALGPGADIVKPAGFDNNSLAAALWVDGGFRQGANGEIQDAGSRPHVTIAASGDGSLDYYAFSVDVAGSTATFDIDGGYPSFDSWLRLFDAAGGQLAENDDALTDPGSIEVYPSFTRDSFVTYTFAASGSYVIAVGAYSALAPVPAGAGYSLHISLDNAADSAAAGDDELHGGNSRDTLIGGAGDDRLEGDGGNDLVTAGAGRDRGWGGGGRDTLRGEGGDDRLFGGDGADSLAGGHGNDLLRGDGGSDTLSGGAGDDTLGGGYGDNSLTGGSGDDRLSARSGNDTLRGGAGFDAIAGNSGDDRLFGGSGGDSLAGGGGNDNLAGGDGDDRLAGGAGIDRMRGGAGNDSFVFAAVADSLPSGQRDKITDFEQGKDSIDLSGIDAIDGGSDDAFTFIGPVGSSHVAGQLRQFHTATATIIAGDVDGDGHGDFQIRLAGNYTLTDGDFVL